MDIIPGLLAAATLAPLISFWVILFGGPRLGKNAAWVAISAIVFAGICSFASLAVWLHHNPVDMGGHGVEHAAHQEDHQEGHDEDRDKDGHEPERVDQDKDHDKEQADGDKDAEKHADPSAPADGSEEGEAGDDCLPLDDAKDDEGGAEKETSEQAAPDGDKAAGEAGAEAEHAEGDDAKSHAGQEKAHDDGHADGHAHKHKPEIAGVFYTLGKFGSIELNISYYVDALTIAMFCMVTLIATCIHFYAMGYMHDEEHDVTDHEVTLGDGSHLTRPGRYYRFFQYLSLFCFSMLGIVLSGNIAMVFVFWELVGICSYFLIGFYVERKSASTAANKAFITNRVGDFGMILGLMALWTSLGTFSFGDIETKNEAGEVIAVEHGIFSLVRPDSHHNELQTPDGMVLSDASAEVSALAAAEGWREVPHDSAVLKAKIEEWRQSKYGYWLLILAGVGIFCGCVGKSAQFPLHVWLPDAMEGPTPVSALVHSATMVAAGVYLVGRFFPVFAPEVLLVIAVAGCITLFMAATIAITATDIKRVLAYSTVSQLGYMMLALGVGGWVAGLMHLITHAFFKSLLFMCSGSVIHAVHTNEMPEMGGLRKKMPVTAYTMLVGCLAIAGAGIPFLVGFSGYYSKDAILEQAYSFSVTNGFGLSAIFFGAATGGAAITAFYMFRLWYLTFAGKPRNAHRYDHAHESPRVMYMPLVVLSVFAVTVAWSPFEATLVGGVGLAAAVIWLLKATASGQNRRAALTVAAASGAILLIGLVWNHLPIKTQLGPMLEQARPDGTLQPMTSVYGVQWTWPDEHVSHDYATAITPVATAVAIAGFAFASIMYGLGLLNPDDARRQFQGIYRFLLNKWWFDELYDFIFIRPTHVISRVISGFDRTWIDGFLHAVAKCTRWISGMWDTVIDRTAVDGTIEMVLGNWVRSAGYSLRVVQTGRLRQYVMFIALGAIVLFVLISFFMTSTPPVAQG